MAENTKGVKRVVYYVGEAGDGKKYPTNMVLYDLKLERVSDNMTLDEKKAVYNKNLEVVNGKIQAIKSLKGAVVFNSTGKYGNITTRTGEVKKVKDVVNETIAQHPESFFYTKPRTIFFDYTCIMSLHRFFKEHPERKGEFFAGVNSEKKTVFFDNFAESADRISPAEAMMLYQYLELTGGPNGVENALKSYPSFREKMVNEYYKPQVDHIFYLAKEKAKKTFLQPGSENNIKYREAVAKAENIRNMAYRDIGLEMPGDRNTAPNQAKDGKIRSASEPAKKTAEFLADYKLKVADEMVEEDMKTSWKELSDLKPVNADAGKPARKNSKSSKKGRSKEVDKAEKTEPAAGDEKPSVFGGIFSPDDIKRLASQIRLINAAYKTEDEKIEAMKKKVLSSRDLRELLYRAGETEEAEKILSEAGAGDDAKVFFKLRDEQKIPMPSVYQRAASSGFKSGETRAVIAVPGSGKTTSLIYTIESLLAEKKAKPGEITMISYTTGAAAEFRKRILERNPDLAGVGLHISTAHSLARSILRKYAPEVSLDILSESDQQKLIEDKVIPELVSRTKMDAELLKQNLDSALKVVKLAPWSSKQLREACQQYKYIEDNLKLALEIYNSEKTKLGKIDYDDLMINAMKLLETNDKARAEVQAHAKVLMVDEYQDTAPLQRALEKLLLPEDGIKIEVGDDHQAIFTSLGARSDYLQSDAVENKENYYVLPTNYRSSPSLIEAFNDIKDSIELSSKKDMFPAPEKSGAEVSEGPKAEVQEFTKKGGDVSFILNDIKRRLGNGEKAEDIAILCRWNDDAKAIEKAIKADPELKNLLPQNAKNPIIDAFVENKAAEMLRPVLESLAEPENAQLFNRMIKTVMNPTEKSSGSVYVSVENAEKSPLDEFREKTEENDGNKPQKRSFLRAYEEALEKDDARDAVETFLARYCGYTDTEEFREDNGYISFADKSQYDDFMDTLSMRNVQRSEGLNFAASMDDIGNAEKSVEKKGGLNIKTVHKAKGEEYETVYMFRQNQDSLSRFYSQIEDNEIRANHRIEEDKIVYTGITRAKTNLIITGTANNIAEIYRKIRPEHVLWYKDGVKLEKEDLLRDCDLKFIHLKPPVETESRAKRMSRLD